MKLFLAIFAATVVLGPTFSIAFYLVAAFLLGDLPCLATSAWLAIGGVEHQSPRLRTIELIREHGLRLVVLAYGFGGFPALLGGVFLGRRFSRTPPRTGAAAPIAFGVALSALMAVTLIAVGGARAPFDKIALLAGMTMLLGFASAAACWATARLIHGLMVRSPR